jgi:hypothetical protein
LSNKNKKSIRAGWYAALFDFLQRVPLPAAACQFSSRYLSGVFLSPKDKKVKSHFILPMEKGIIEPSFYKTNIPDGAAVERLLGDGMARLSPGGRKLVILLPELAQKVFIFTFDSLPSAPEEKEELIRYRIKKQMPLLPRDIRLAYATHAAGDQARIIASVAKTSVVQEYEEIMQRLKFRVVMAGVPSLSLLNLLDPDQERDFVLLDVEDDSFSLVTVIEGNATLYRQKPFGIHAGQGQGVEAKADNIVQEVVNTINFVEDKEKTRLASVWLRLGILQEEDGLQRRMEERLALPLRRIETSDTRSLEAGAKRILSPLIGQIG